MSISGSIALAGILLITSSCSRSRSTDLSRPAIYDAWEARYSYQLEDRRMVPIYQGREVGRSWGRDVQGRLSVARYVGSSAENDEDLFSLHQSRLDKMRTREWESAKQARIEVVKDQLADLEEEEEAPLLELDFDEEDDEFIPPPSFIPAGIDLGQGDQDDDSPQLNEEPSDALDMPFAPLPL